MLVSEFALLAISGLKLHIACLVGETKNNMIGSTVSPHNRHLSVRGVCALLGLKSSPIGCASDIGEESECSFVRTAFTQAVNSQDSIQCDAYVMTRREYLLGDFEGDVAEIPHSSSNTHSFWSSDTLKPFAVGHDSWIVEVSNDRGNCMSLLAPVFSLELALVLDR